MALQQKLTPEGAGGRLISGITASVGKKVSRVNINPSAPSVEDEKTCDALGGDWNDEYDVCIMVDTPEGGWTAPIKGMYLWHSVTDLYDATGDEELKGQYMAEVIGCLVADSGFYPTFAGGCSPILEMEVRNRYGSEIFDDKDEAKREAKEEMLDVARDILKGDARYWGLEYCNTKGKRTTPDDPYAIVSDDCEDVARIMREARGIKPIDEFLKE